MAKTRLGPTTDLLRMLPMLVALRTEDSRGRRINDTSSVDPYP